MRFPRPETLQGKTTFMLVIALAIAMVFVTLVSTFALQATLQGAVSQTLEERMDEAEIAVANGEYQRAIDLAGHDIIQIVGPDNQVLFASPNAHGNSPMTTQEDPEFYRVNDDHPRMIKKRTVQSPDGPMIIEAEASLERSLADWQQASLLLMFAMANILLLTFILSRQIMKNTLKPVEDMRRQVERIDAKSLADRLPVPENDPDLGPLAKTFNSLLDQIAGYADAYKRFLGNSSHELKSPITAISVTVEALQKHPDEIDVDQGLADIARENDRMKRIVSNLLAMARSDEGRLAMDKHPIDLMDLIIDEVASVRSKAGVPIDTSKVQPVVCNADAEYLGHLIRNLLDNATSYATSRVCVSCSEAEGVVRIVVSDDGPGIPPENRERVFERFIRLEDDGSSQSGRSSTGLGLPVVREIAQLHGGAVYFDEPEVGGATAVVELPA